MKIASKKINELMVYITGKCNLNCDYCLIEKDSLLADRLSLPILKKSLALYIKMPGKEKTITFLGGEPLLEYRLMIDASNYAKWLAQKLGKRLYLGLLTNGLLLNRPIHNLLKRNDFSITLSLDGNPAGQDQHRRTKTGHLSSLILMKNINSMTEEEKRDIKISLVYTPKTFFKLVKNVDFLRKQKFGSIKICFEVGASWQKRHLSQLRNIYKFLLEYYIDFCKENRRPPFKFFNWPGRLNLEKDWQQFTTLALDTRGKFYPSFLPLTLDKETASYYSVGDYKTGIDLKKIELFFKRAYLAISAILNKRCSCCPIFKISRCYHLIYLYLLSKEVNSDWMKNFIIHCKICELQYSYLLEIEKRVKQFGM